MERNHYIAFALGIAVGAFVVPFVRAKLSGN